jgi:catechol 2,3-dioxygenase-like lactoylglutathione lyase family enzyme
MTALAGFHHVSVVTADLERLVDFYRKVFDASVVWESSDDDGVRSSLIDVGGGGFLNAHETPGEQIMPAGRPGCERGPVHHVALHAPTREVFLECRRRAMEAGATDGLVRDFGAAWELKFRDPDGTEGDLIWPAADFPRGAVRRYADAPILLWSETG